MDIHRFKLVAALSIALCASASAQLAQIFVDEDHTNHNILNILDPTTAQGAATKNYVDSRGGSANSQVVSGGGVACSTTNCSNLSFVVSAATYIINGVQYTSPQTTVTLATADPTNPRIDTIAMDTTGAVVVITGTPSANPVAPVVDPATQVFDTFIQVPAGSTSPSFTTENVYLENTEWTMSTNSSGTINLASTNNPFAGTKDIEGTATANGNNFTGVRPGGTEALNGFTSLTFQLRSKASWPSQKAISVNFQNGSTNVGTSVAVKSGTFGFNSATTTSYQQIVIPISSFGTAASLIDRVRFSVTGSGSSIGWYIDNIVLMGNSGGGGSGGGGGTGNVTSAVTSSTDKQIALFSGSTGVLITPATGSGIVKDASGVYGHAVSGTDYAPATSGSSILYGNASGGFSNVTVGTGLSFSSGTLSATGGTQTHTVTFVVDGSGSVITAGTAAYIKIPYGGTLQGWTLIASPASSSVTCDILRAADGGGLPTASIVGGSGTKPAISSGVENSSTSFTSWTSTTLTAKDNLAVSTSGITAATYVALTLYYQ